MSSPEDQFYFPAYDGRYFSGIPLSTMFGRWVYSAPHPASSLITFFMDCRLAVSSECRHYVAPSILDPSATAMPSRSPHGFRRRSDGDSESSRTDSRSSSGRSRQLTESSVADIVVQRLDRHLEPLRTSLQALRADIQ